MKNFPATLVGAVLLLAVTAAMEAIAPKTQSITASPEVSVAQRELATSSHSRFIDSALTREQSADESESPLAEAAASGQPQRLVIQSIDVDVELQPLDVDDEGIFDPLPGTAGWYSNPEAVKPGAVGSAMIGAHINWDGQPDVFSQLHELKPGNAVEVHYSNGQIATFVVEESVQLDKDDLPIERILRATSRPRLSLITCGGQFDYSVGHYDDNTIVYTSFKGWSDSFVSGSGSG